MLFKIIKKNYKLRKNFIKKKLKKLDMTIQLFLLTNNVWVRWIWISYLAGDMKNIIGNMKTTECSTVFDKPFNDYLSKLYVSLSKYSFTCKRALCTQSPSNNINSDLCFSLHTTNINYNRVLENV